eukprot:Em0004g79a
MHASGSRLGTKSGLSERREATLSFSIGWGSRGPPVCRGLLPLVHDGHLRTQTSLHLPGHDQQGAHFPLVPGKDLEHRTGLRVHHAHATSTGANEDLPALAGQAEDVGGTLCVLGLAGWLTGTFSTEQ